MPLAELRDLIKAKRAAGGKLAAYGKTVFEGTRIERFDVEIIDILPKFLPDQDLILIRASHPRIGQGGIIAGMSGSPVYVNDKVIGAVAYGWGFAREPLGGVTPIESMLAELKRPVEFKSGERPAGPGRRAAAPLERAPVRRAGTPLLAAGLGARALASLETDLGPWGFLPLQAGGGGADDGGVDLEAGAAVGVRLLSGDSDLTAVGTLTYRDGDRVLAFGHPFFNAGEIALPVTTAVVHTVMPSLERPFKLASPGRDMGSLVQDRTACVAGRLGAVAPTIPLEVSIRNRKTGDAKTYHFRVVQHDILTPAIVRTAAFSAADAWDPGFGMNSVLAVTTIRLKGVDAPVVVRNTFATEGETFTSATLRAFRSLFDNPFEKPVFESIAVSLDVVHEERIAEVKQAWLDEDEVDAGASAWLNVVLKPRRGAETRRRVEIPVPAGLRGRELSVHAAGGGAVDPQSPPPTTLRELAASLQAPYDATQLVVVVDLPTTDLRYRGAVLDRIPNSILGPLVPGLSDPALLTPTSRRIVVPTDWVLDGTEEVKIRVK